VFYVGHVDKSSLYETIFHCNILSPHHHTVQNRKDKDPDAKLTNTTLLQSNIDRVYGKGIKEERLHINDMIILLFISNQIQKEILRLRSTNNPEMQR
jgi:hypothetical protein